MLHTMGYTHTHTLQLLTKWGRKKTPVGTTNLIRIFYLGIFCISQEGRGIVHGRHKNKSVQRSKLNFCEIILIHIKIEISNFLFIHLKKSLGISWPRVYKECIRKRVTWSNLPPFSELWFTWSIFQPFSELWFTWSNLLPFSGLWFTWSNLLPFSGLWFTWSILQPFSELWFTWSNLQPFSELWFT